LEASHIRRSERVGRSMGMAGHNVGSDCRKAFDKPCTRFVTSIWFGVQMMHAIALSCQFDIDVLSDRLSSLEFPIVYALCSCWWL